MVSMQARNAYSKAQESAKIHPVKLIHMLYERLMVNLANAAEAVADGDPKRRGENLSKATAIITELNCSVRAGDDSEPAQFLRTLYATMMVELAKVGVNGGTAAIEQTSRYVERLKGIWEETAMQENGFDVKRNAGVRPSDLAEKSPRAYLHPQAKKGGSAVSLCVSA